MSTYSGQTRISRHSTFGDDETFIAEAGDATFTVDGQAFELGAGQIVVVPANTPHKFVSGEGFRLISISPADHMQQENLEG